MARPTRKQASVLNGPTQIRTGGPRGCAASSIGAGGLFAGDGRLGGRKAATRGGRANGDPLGMTMAGAANDPHSGQNWQSGIRWRCDGGVVSSPEVVMWQGESAASICAGATPGCGTMAPNATCATSARRVRNQPQLEMRAPTIAPNSIHSDDGGTHAPDLTSRRIL